MIESVSFENFRVLRKATLPLSPFTLIVGPNGSGKSTALQGLVAAGQPRSFARERIVTVGVEKNTDVRISIVWRGLSESVVSKTVWSSGGGSGHNYIPVGPLQLGVQHALEGTRVFALDAQAIAARVSLQPVVLLGSNGSNLAGVLDRLRDTDPEKFEQLNLELGGWMPEFDRILFETPEGGSRAFSLRVKQGHHSIPAADLSHGTLLALALLTLTYMADAPAILCLEEPDRGIHPRLLRDVKDAIHRLSYPAEHGRKGDPVQVIATTHSPYMLDLFRESPEEIVIAHKEGSDIRFERLSDRPDINEILEGANLGDVWYSGVLGGVPSRQ